MARTIELPRPRIASLALEVDWRRWRRRLIAGVMVFTLAGLAGVAVFTYLAYQRAASDLVIERDQQVTYLSAARLKDEMLKVFGRSCHIGSRARNLSRRPWCSARRAA